ncbi:MAG TPA: VanZ family protein [Gemmatimonadaceae bacterium]|nr:VanZ family protein [Gemmatimonadaceae bacterium]
MSVRQWGPPVLWAAFILLLTSIPGSDLPHVSFLAFRDSDKLVHGTMYAVFAWLGTRTLLRAGRPLRQAILIVMLGIALFAVLDEWHQQFIPGRSMDVFDWLADISGATIGALVAAVAPRVRERSEA